MHKWRLGADDNHDSFYTNLISAHSFFATLTDVLRSDVENGAEQAQTRQVVAVALSLYADVVEKLRQSRNRTLISDSAFMSILVREDNNLVAHLCSFLHLLLHSAPFAKIAGDFHEQVAEVAKAALLYVYTIRNHVFVSAMGELVHSLFECLASVGHAEEALKLAVELNDYGVVSDMYLFSDAGAGAVNQHILREAAGDFHRFFVRRCNEVLRGSGSFKAKKRSLGYLTRFRVSREATSRVLAELGESSSTLR